MTQRVTPQLRMTSWEGTRKFYVDGLGFAVDWEHRFEPGFPVFAQLTRDGLSLFLTEHEGDCKPGGAAYIVVDDVDGLFDEIRARGVRPAEAPEDSPWHTREMLVLDPDGNRLRFSSAKADREETTGIGTRLVPALLVRDMQETLAFYETLGFRVTGCHPDRANANWAELERDGVAFQFHTDPPHGTPPAPVCSGTFYLYPESVGALADDLRGRVEFAWGPEVMEYGMREFGIRDPNGYILAFTERA